MSKLSELYDRDFLPWTEDQARALRRAKGANVPLDWDNLAEEIEDLGKSERKAVRCQIRRILRHLSKLAALRSAAPRNGWRRNIRDPGIEMEDAFEDSPSLRRKAAHLVAQQNTGAAKLAVDDFARHGAVADAIRARLEQGGFTAGQVLGARFPESPA